MKQNPFERLTVYTESTEGGVRINVEAMLNDIIAVAKMDGLILEELQGAIARVWPSVNVDLFIPKEHKQ